MKFLLFKGGKVKVAGALARTGTGGLEGRAGEYFCNQLGELLINRMPSASGILFASVPTP